MLALGLILVVFYKGSLEYSSSSLDIYWPSRKKISFCLTQSNSNFGRIFILVGSSGGLYMIERERRRASGLRWTAGKLSVRWVWTMMDFHKGMDTKQIRERFPQIKCFACVLGSHTVSLFIFRCTVLELFLFPHFF